MKPNVSTAKTKRFIDYWVYAPGAIAACLLLLGLFGSSFANTLVDKRISVEESEAVKVDTIDLKPSKIGALRIDVRSSLDAVNLNDWIVYEIQLRDRNGRVIASAIDEDWQESGTWQEDGESGSWRESDLSGGIDLRAIEGEQIDVVIQLLERQESTGVATSVFFNVKIQNRVIDRRPLFWGASFGSILALTALSATPYSGKKVIQTKIRDSDPQARDMVGGKDKLVRVKIQTKLDETTPRNIKINLAIDNEHGEAVYRNSQTCLVSIHKDDGRITGGSAKLTSFFILEPYGSYRFKVDVIPDNPVDWTSLEVRQGGKTLTEVEVTTVTGTSN